LNTPTAVKSPDAESKDRGSASTWLKELEILGTTERTLF